MSSSQPSILVYGATSFTALQFIEYIESHSQAKAFHTILAGRNGAKLEKLNAKLGGKWDTVAFELEDDQVVQGHVERCSIVVNFAGRSWSYRLSGKDFELIGWDAAGPFKDNNAEMLVRACATLGKHYVDLTGEATWLANDIIPKYDFLASKTGACIVPACGFDAVPFDLVVYSSLRSLQTAHPEASIVTSKSFVKAKGSISGGTLASVLSVADLPRRERNDGEWGMIPNQKQPDTPVRMLYSAFPSVGRALYGSVFPFYIFNRALVRRSWFLSRLSIAGNDEPRHGEVFAHEEGLRTGNSPVMAVLVSAVIVVVGALFMGSKLIRSILMKALPQPGEGVSRKELDDGFIDITHYATSDSNPPVEILTKYVASGDPGYLHTAHILAESALSLILPPPKGTQLPPLGKIGGVLTPSTAMGMVLVERLRQNGCAKIESEILKPGGRSLEGN
ncbi:hypothetical protein P7C73_g2462, partial [Tremellales sp. Uapishka_1]